MSHLLLPPRVCLSRKLSGVQQGFKPKHSNTGDRCPKGAFKLPGQASVSTVELCVPNQAGALNASQRGQDDGESSRYCPLILLDSWFGFSRTEVLHGKSQRSFLLYLKKVLKRY